MIVYFDTSALVPLMVAEPSSGSCRRLWEGADDVATVRMAYAEAAAALARALRLGRMDGPGHRGALQILDRLWAELALVEVDEELVRAAAAAAYEYGLRGDDAVHCAAAARVGNGDLVVAGGDSALLSACAALGLATADVNQEP